MIVEESSGRAARPVVVIVSGLPRSGTSMLMQMLEAGGVPLLQDGLRPADADNPRGFFELEAVKRLETEPGFLAQAVGRAVKVVAPLLKALPPHYAYRILFIERDLDEVLASQRRMLERAGIGTGAGSEVALRRAFEGALRTSREWIEREGCARACFVSHAETLASPRATATRVAEFLASQEPAQAPLAPGLEQWVRRFAADPDGVVQTMAAAVDPSLHRAGTARVRQDLRPREA